MSQRLLSEDELEAEFRAEVEHEVAYLGQAIDDLKVRMSALDQRTLELADRKPRIEVHVPPAQIETPKIEPPPLKKIWILEPTERIHGFMKTVVAKADDVAEWEFDIVRERDGHVRRVVARRA